ncbi:hypothetical protein PIB30_064496 [Stylosanthes scabra]|uniref:Uncharacterized protein n=1 Tax=Stylosanthes scabra TaxID=79078 RepID=A0ABU6UQH8_9FABA|nr:hypothetical protein [Stylosanthes scabra]
MLACSRFGWNKKKQYIEVDGNDVFDAWLKDRKIGSAVVSGFDAEEQVNKESEEDEPVLDDYFMSSTPTIDAPSQTQGNVGQGTTSSVNPGASSRRISRKKRKQADILERMTDEVHESTVVQREHVKILANVISRKNDEVKMGEKLEQLGFSDHDAIHVVVKICADPWLEKSFWGLTDVQKTTIA